MALGLNVSVSQLNFAWKSGRLNAMLACKAASGSATSVKLAGGGGIETRVGPTKPGGTPGLFVRSSGSWTRAYVLSAAAADDRPVSWYILIAWRIPVATCRAWVQSCRATCCPHG